MTKPKPLPVIPPYGEHAIDLQNLTFAYTSGATTLTQEENVVLQELFLQLTQGSRCLLIGGKSSPRQSFSRYLADLTSHLSIFSQWFRKVHFAQDFGRASLDVFQKYSKTKHLQSFGITCISRYKTELS